MPYNYFKPNHSTPDQTNPAQLSPYQTLPIQTTPLRIEKSEGNEIFPQNFPLIEIC